MSTIAPRRPARFREILRWTTSGNPWRRRIAAYVPRDFVFAGELDKRFQLLERLLYDDEFWVQRAVGTRLRERWKKDRRRTESFLRRHVRGLPRVVIRLATDRAKIVSGRIARPEHGPGPKAVPPMTRASAAARLSAGLARG